MAQPAILGTGGMVRLLLLQLRGFDIYLPGAPLWVFHPLPVLQLQMLFYEIMNYNNTVLKETLQYDDLWGRVEFAKSRGQVYQVHSHEIVYSKYHHEKIKECLNVTNDKEKARQVQKWLQSNQMNDAVTFSPNFTSMHPASGEMIINNDGESEWVPNDN